MVKIFKAFAILMNLRITQGQSELDLEEEFAIAGIQLPPTNGKLFVMI
jgi:hypothetical protein